MATWKWSCYFFFLNLMLMAIAPLNSSINSLMIEFVCIIIFKSFKIDASLFVLLNFLHKIFKIDLIKYLIFLYNQLMSNIFIIFYKLVNIKCQLNLTGSYLLQLKFKISKRKKIK